MNGDCADTLLFVDLGCWVCSSMSCLKNVSADPQIGEYFTVVFHTCTGTYEKGELSKLTFEHVIQQSVTEEEILKMVDNRPTTYVHRISR